MCCYGNLEATNRFLAKNKHKKFVYCYKVVNENYISPFYQKRFKKGWNKSNSSARLITRDRNIERGIHVYINKTNPIYPFEIIIKVRCYLKDFIGCNKSTTHAVFRKVYVEKL